jgi:hypothetical protein
MTRHEALDALRGWQIEVDIEKENGDERHLSGVFGWSGGGGGYVMNEAPDEQKPKWRKIKPQNVRSIYIPANHIRIISLKLWN